MNKLRRELDCHVRLLATVCADIASNLQQNRRIFKNDHLKVVIVNMVKVGNDLYVSPTNSRWTLFYLFMKKNLGSPLYIIT